MCGGSERFKLDTSANVRCGRGSINDRRTTRLNEGDQGMFHLSVRGTLLASVVALAVLFAAQGFASAAHTGFGFNGDLSGAAGAASLSGGGSFDLESGFLRSGGGFRCTETV